MLGGESMVDLVLMLLIFYLDLIWKKLAPIGRSCLVRDSVGSKGNACPFSAPALSFLFCCCSSILLNKFCLPERSAISGCH